MANAPSESSPRERLLAAANELFYAEGIRTVGIDRIIERAGVAKASLYSAFGSKDELVRAYLAARSERRRQRIQAQIARHQSPRERILSVFDLLGDIVKEQGFRGCPFVNASAEGSREGPVAEACTASRAWLRELFVGEARALGAKDPDEIGRRLALLYSAVIVNAAMDRDPGVADEGRAMAEILLDSIEMKAGKRR